MLNFDKLEYVSRGTELFEALSNHDIKYILIQSWAGTGKSVLLANILWQMVFKESFLVIRKIQNTLKNSCYQAITDVIYKRAEKAWILSSDYWDITKSPLEIWSKIDKKGRIYFGGMDDPEKIKSIWWANWFKWIWIEEATELNFEDFEQLDLRLRWKTNQKIILTYNPVNINSWIKTKLLDSSTYSPLIKLIHPNILQNQFIDESYIQKLKNLKDTNPNKYRVYYEWERGQAMEWVIYPNYKTFDYDIIPDSIWIDFWRNDPTAITFLKVEDKWDKKDLYVQEKVYKSQMTSNDIINKLKELDIWRTLIIWDNARPEMIDDIKKAWFNIISCTKWPWSVTQWITKAQEYNIYIQWPNIEKEISMYCWKKSRNEILDIPEDWFDHCMDSMRYWLQKRAKPKKKWFTFIFEAPQ